MNTTIQSSLFQRELNVDNLLDKLVEDMFFFAPQLLHPQVTQSLRELALSKKMKGNFSAAGVGKLGDYTQDKQVRKDEIWWLPEEPSALVLQQIFHFLNELKATINRTLFLSLKDFECHFALYKSGAFYKRHIDQFKQNVHRHLSFVFYLHESWQPCDGGELMLYPPSKNSIEIQPLPGSFILFRSDLEHEVLKTTAKRISLTGWLLDIEKGMTFL